MNLSYSEIRAKARESLGGKIFSKNWLLALVALVLVDVITNVAAFITCGLGALIITGPLTLGLSKMFLDTLRDPVKGIGIGTLFEGFKSFGKSFVLYFMQSLFIILWSFLFIIPGIVKSFAYSMAFYIMADHPEYTWNECLKESQRMMKGHKFHLFCLNLSFIGWILVGMFTCGLAFLWINPYQQAAIAAFYNELKAENEPQANFYEVN